MKYTRSCANCGASLVREPGVGWVDSLNGDDGGTYDICPDNHASRGSRGHRMQAQVEHMGWTWDESIGLYYGHGPSGETEQVCQPLMSSSWVVLHSEYADSLAEHGDGQPPKGTFVRIFDNYQQAMEFVAQKEEVGA